MAVRSLLCVLHAYGIKLTEDPWLRTEVKYVLRFAAAEGVKVKLMYNCGVDREHGYKITLTVQFYV